MLPESDNAIWGRSANPWDLSRTPGGSSGGEGSLLASRSTPLAIGSDVGGSIRIPAHFTGTCGLKPTPERMTRKGMSSISKVCRRPPQGLACGAHPAGARYFFPRPDGLCASPVFLGALSQGVAATGLASQ